MGYGAPLSPSFPRAHAPAPPPARTVSLATAGSRAPLLFGAGSAASPDGKTLYYTDSTATLRHVHLELDGSGSKVNVTAAVQIVDPALTPYASIGARGAANDGTGPGRRIFNVGYTQTVNNEVWPGPPSVNPLSLPLSPLSLPSVPHRRWMRSGHARLPAAALGHHLPPRGEGPVSCRQSAVHGWSVRQRLLWLHRADRSQQWPRAGMDRRARAGAPIPSILAVARSLTCTALPRDRSPT
eukprot:7390208-Prymnesium_polylepis.2